MTREEKEQTGKYVLQMARLLEDGCYQQEMLKKAVHIIDEALEQEPFINKPCVSSGVCEHDKNKVLDKIRAEITAIAINGQVDEHTMFIRAGGEVKQMALDIIDKYKAESEG